MGTEVTAVENETIAAPQTSYAVRLAQADLDTQIATARAYPRDIAMLAGRFIQMVTSSDQAAEDSMYSLPRGGKTIEGPSIRFAEALQAVFGNCRVAARVVEVNPKEKWLEAEGIFHDLESNAATAARIRRRISDKHGRLFKEDMQVVAGNAAQSIARRNAILAGVPRVLWWPAYEAVRQRLMGDLMTLTNSRAQAITSFQRFGVTKKQLLDVLGLRAEDEITQDKLVTLRGMFAALKNGEATVEEMFTPAKHTHTPLADPLADPVANEKPSEDGPSKTTTTDDAAEPDAEQATPQLQAKPKTGGATKSDPKSGSNDHPL